MHFLKAITITITSILAAASAAPTTTTTENPTHVETIMKRNHEDKCGVSTFENKSSAASPWVIDCQHLIYNIRKGGTWALHAGKHRELAQYGSCAFDAQSVDGILDIWIGNGDIIDVVRDSISRFQTEDGKVGARGIFECRGIEVGGDGWTPVEWGLYATR